MISPRREGWFLAAPGVSLRLRAAEEVHQLARILWTETDEFGEPSFDLHLEFSAPRPVPGDLEERMKWTLSPGRFVLAAGDQLAVETDVALRRVSALVSSSLMEERPGLVSRLALETPIAILLSRHGYAALHAGAVCSRGRAVAIRGASGAGKSTLVAALWKEGFRILGDESFLVRRERPSELMASVRELTILPDTHELLWLGDCATPAFSGGERKFRIDLSAGARPEDRFASHAATVLLGPREPGPARLEPLSRPGFIEAFGEGAVREEAEPESLSGILSDWADRPIARLRGADDLAGAVREIRRLLENA